jgi:hypothetical protein
MMRYASFASYVIFVIYADSMKILLMKHGGNSRFHEQLGKAGFGGNTAISALYLSTEAEAYRSHLKDIVANSTLANIEDTLNMTSLSSYSVSSKRHGTHLDVTFIDGPMGMSISKDHNGRAFVSRLVSNGAAETKGVQVGDVIEVVAGKRMGGYDQIMHMIPMMPRPLILMFFRGRAMSDKDLLKEAAESTGEEIEAGEWEGGDALGALSVPPSHRHSSSDSRLVVGTAPSSPLSPSVCQRAAPPIPLHHISPPHPTQANILKHSPPSNTVK